MDNSEKQSNTMVTSLILYSLFFVIFRISLWSPPCISIPYIVCLKTVDMDGRKRIKRKTPKKTSCFLDDIVFWHRFILCIKFHLRVIVRQCACIFILNNSRMRVFGCCCCCYCCCCFSFFTLPPLTKRNDCCLIHTHAKDMHTHTHTLTQTLLQVYKIRNVYRVVSI